MGYLVVATKMFGCAPGGPLRREHGYLSNHLPARVQAPTGRNGIFSRYDTLSRGRRCSYHACVAQPTLFAVHLSDGVVAGPWLVGGWVVAALIVAAACRRIDEAEVPRIGVLTAAFFVGSQVHLPLGGVSAHLLLNGLVGVILGMRAGLAIAVGLLLQSLLLGHGRLTVLGVNVAVYALPAVAAGAACGPLRR